MSVLCTPFQVKCYRCITTNYYTTVLVQLRSNFEDPAQLLKSILDQWPTEDSTIRSFLLL